MAVNLPSFKTEETDSLCREIARKSGGVIFCGLSRGKDSLCAYLFLRRYFKKANIIPFHCASYPGLKHVKETLDYYESVLDTRILRLVGEELPMALPRMMYQTPDDIEELESLDTPNFSKLDILEYLRYEFNLPRAWCAFGIAASDSIDRRIYCNKIKGRNPSNMTFYPCWDWPRAEILKAVRESGVRLSGEYRWSSRTLGGIPSATCNRIYKEHYPEDWNRILAMYPLAEAKTLRELYLDRAFERRKALGIVPDETEADVAEEESAADMMPEMGM